MKKFYILGIFALLAIGSITTSACSSKKTCQCRDKDANNTNSYEVDNDKNCADLAAEKGEAACD